MSGWRFPTTTALLTALLTSTPGSAVAQEVPVRVVAAVPARWPPDYVLDDEGRPDGFALEVFNVLARRAGLEVQWLVKATFAEAIDALREGRADIIPNLGISEERAAFCLFTEPLETARIELFIRSDMQPVVTVEQLAGRTVAVVESNVAVPRLKQEHPELRVHVFRDTRSALFELLAGHVDGLVHPSEVLLHMAQEAGVADRIRVLGGPLWEVKRAVAVRRDLPEVHQRLSVAVSELVGSPEYQALYVKWHTRPSFWTVERVLLGMGVMLIASLLLMAGWRYQSLRQVNRQLRETIVERERAERARQDSEQQLVQSQKMEAVGQLAGGVAHDFNNILTVIQGLGDIVLDSLPSGSPARGDMEDLLAASKRAAALTRQLLTFSRKQIGEPQVISVHAVLEGMVPLLHRAVSERIQLEVVTTPGLWPVHVDPNQMEQVILNLVLNARDAMPTGGRIRLATTNVPGPPEHVVLTVSDTGQGMTPEVQRRIFEPFFTTKEHGRGTGLGLSTCYAIVQGAGGHIRVSSEVGRGATFEVFLPRCHAEPTTRAAAPVRTVRAGWETILVAEDDAALRSLVVRTLTAAGYRVVPASNGEEALRRASAHEGPIHLLLTDVVMPGLDGPSLARELARVRDGVAVLFMSGYTDNENLQRGVAEGRMAFLPKPFTPEVLEGRVAQVLAGRA
ncbi:MAG: transporter substrate-binding domain-containing protein [Myxococcota bacterium]